MSTPMPEHTCQPPDLTNWDHEEDEWTCPECGQVWDVEALNYCYSCYRSDGYVWVKRVPYTGPTTDGGFPLISVRRGGMTWGDRREIEPTKDEESKP
jgi:hypothetical protein